MKKNNTRQLTKRETAELKRRTDEFGRGLYEFASQAYFAALDYYSKHYNDPVALLEFKRDADAGIDKTEAGLAQLILAIMNHPKCPTDLYNAMAHWTSDAIDIKDSRGETLLDRWRHDPATVTACVAWANEEDDNRESAKELTARVAKG